MKKLNEKQRIRQLRVRRLRKKKFLNKSGNGNSHQVVLVHLSPPSIMSFTRNYTETVEFLDEFRSLALNGHELGKKLKSIDMTTVSELTIPVAIVFAADFERWSRIQKFKLKPINIEQWNPDIIKMFRGLGIFSLTNISDEASGQFGESFTLYPLQSGLETEGEKISDMQSWFSDILDTFTTLPSLYEGLNEAVENAIIHAYPSELIYQPRHRYAGHRWWGVSCLDMGSETLRFFVYDQGAGIPTTLPRSGLWEKTRRLISDATAGISGTNLGDEGMILEKALEAGRTQTLEAHRGLGLKKMQEVVSKSPGSFLRIISGKGEIKCGFGGQIENKSHNNHIGGTLIEWCIPADAFKSRD